MEKNLSFKAHPVGSYYTQFALANGTFNANEAPGVLFGGTWTLQFNGEGVFFRTEGGQAADKRSNGIQEDRIRNITGNYFLSNPAQASPEIDEASGFRAPYKSLTIPTAPATGPVYNHPRGLSFDASRVVPVGSDNTPRNRLMRVYKRTA